MASRRSTSTTSTAAAKTVATSTPAAEVESPEASLVNVVKKKELIERVSEASGVKRGLTKKVIESLLKEMGDILQDGGELNVPPLGKLSVNRQKEIANAFILIAKLRRPKGMLAEKKPKVEGEDGAVDAASENAAE
ncbi:DNA-binding protein [Pacificibacter maritimus]|uniref:DNA-binding protein n=1 Tax=Pacificibacter maritimus TaxID=762213 RepID=A0A3N4USR2_9RHOB|nr:HU family DNA-binding protein [Pacificibacter maritimus]RPE71745.1 DNA-binding protein [Pacificibacter maritimus]